MVTAAVIAIPIFISPVLEMKLVQAARRTRIVPQPISFAELDFIVWVLDVYLVQLERTRRKQGMKAALHVL